MIKNIVRKYNNRYGTNSPLGTRFFYVSSFICFIGFLANIILSFYFPFPIISRYIYIAGCLFVVIINICTDHTKTENGKELMILLFCIGINIFLLPAIYITSGGIHSAVAMYFIVGVIISILLLHGKKLVIVLLVENIVYAITFAISFFKPEIVNHFMIIEDERFASVALGCVLTGLAIGNVLRIMTNGFEDERTKSDEIIGKLEDLTTRDALTGAYNRRFLMSYIDDCIERINADELGTFSIIMYDIDHFKHVNDTYGHIAGDEVLKSFTNILCSSMRSADIVARYGGEEFIIIMPTADELTAFRRAEQIRAKIEGAALYDEIKEIITVSGGISSYAPLLSVEAIIEKADKNLYIAKDTGRNKIVWKNGKNPPLCYSIYC
ncbi:MAG: diguanylate cyclase [Clostridia bacterium]|nr:diguanylate cyclase [Clostridia bacterium]